MTDVFSWLIYIPIAMVFVGIICIAFEILSWFLSVVNLLIIIVSFTVFSLVCWVYETVRNFYDRC